MDCPHLPDFDPGLPESVDAAFACAPALVFFQNWMTKPDAAFESGIVRLGWRENRLCFDAQLMDANPMTLATQRNEPLYELGDTLEFFAGVSGQKSYIEYHFAPNGTILQLHWPRCAREIDIPAAGGLGGFSIRENYSVHAASRMPRGWRVTASVYLPDLSPRASSLRGAAIDFHFARYDYSSPKGVPVLSSTAPLTRRCFHDRAHWHQITCGAPGA